jgi:hypothetical protein
LPIQKEANAAIEKVFIVQLSVRPARFSSACDPAAVLIDDALAVLLKKFALLRGQEVDHEFRRPAESYPLRRHHDRPVEDNGMRLECVEQGVLGAVAICVGIDFGAISSVTILPHHAARSKI